ncbi:TPA: Cys-Gln thioester bond-forming surface protein, partial [Streptococcus suis]|nr:Cys-Gln thioester bond-forming surface protein [Streptococcus suis]HEM6386062.1 Cys-Gln thioester bond-forming surface protein [Streptococcus suis]
MRKEKKWLHRISSMILSFLMVLQVFSSSFGNMQVHAQDDADIWQAIGENIGFSFNSIFVKHPIYKEFKLQMFCIEAEKNFPKPEDTNLEYALYKPADDETIMNSFNRPNTSKQVALAGVKKVLWNGYPWDASNYKYRYEVTDEEFQYITTLAMQYWTDSWWGDSRQDYIYSQHDVRQKDWQRKKENKPLLLDLFKDLVGIHQDSDIKEPPVEAEYVLAMPHGTTAANNYQKLLTLDLKKHNVRFIKVDEKGQKIDGAEIKVTKLDPPFTSVLVGDDYNVEWTSDSNENWKEGYLIAGHYQMEETKAPNGGYVPFATFKFDIEPGGKIKFPEGKPSYVTGVETRIEKLNGYDQTVVYFTIKNEKPKE